MEPRTRRRHDHGAHGDGVDRISDLNDDLILVILTRLECARTAARTSVLSRRWRHGLWGRLPELYFLHAPHSALEAALAQVAIPKVSLLHVLPKYPNWCCSQRQGFSTANIASLLRNAARLDPMDLKVIVSLERDNHAIAVELPRFARATSINLDVPCLKLHGGGFPVLERLTIAGCLIDIGVLISRCPYLRALELIDCRCNDANMIHSTTIEELHVTNHYTSVRGLDIVAPVLNKFTLSMNMHRDFAMSLLVPMLDNVSWNCYWFNYDLRIDVMWCLRNLKLETRESGCIVLVLDVRRPAHSRQFVRNLKEVFQFPKCSALELCLEKSEHVYGPMVLNLLTICNSIRRLKLDIQKILGKDEESCAPNCHCDQLHNWRSQNIFLRGLEEVEIENFRGQAHEIDFLKLLFRCAPLTKVIVKLESKVSKNSRGCTETYNFFKANTSVECHVYKKSGKEVIYDYIFI